MATPASRSPRTGASPGCTRGAARWSFASSRPPPARCAMTSRSPVPEIGELDVRGGCLRVAGQARHVRVDVGALDRLAGELATGPVTTRAWEEDHLAGGDTETRAGWTLLLSALNFCFWEDEPRWRVEGADGYMALAAALRRAHLAGVPVARPD